MSKERWYYIDAQVTGRVVVEVRATNRAEAILQVRDGSWGRSPTHIELDVVGKPVVLRGEAVYGDD